MRRRANGASCSEEAVVGRELEALGERIERWRRTRAKKGPMPGELWAAAVSAAEERGLFPVARALNVNFDTLKARLLEVELNRRTGAASTAGFVELSSARVFGAEVVESVVELSKADGARMTIRVRSGQTLDVMALSATFFSAER